jgi:hypothetical protein
MMDKEATQIVIDSIAELFGYKPVRKNITIEKERSSSLKQETLKQNVDKKTGKKADTDSLSYTGENGVFVSYKGEVFQDLPHGKGKLTQSDGVSYNGFFFNGLYHGKGKLTLPSGDMYKGTFEHGVIIGDVEVEYADGSFYAGKLLDGLFHGQGGYVIDGVIYSGEFNKGEFPRNIYIKFPNGAEYSGEFYNGNLSGYGVMYYVDGWVYQGNFVGGIRQGQGKLVSPEGEVYEGNFLNDEYQQPADYSWIWWVIGPIIVGILSFFGFY